MYTSAYSVHSSFSIQRHISETFRPSKNYFVNQSECPKVVNFSLNEALNVGFILL